MKVFVGWRRGSGELEVRVSDVSEEQPLRLKRLEPRLDLWNHSPAGFDCGYHGSGPAQLALAIASAILGPGEFADDVAVRVHQRVKRLCVLFLPKKGFTITEEEVRAMTGLPLAIAAGTCAGCGCTDDDCSGCFERTGERCYWVAPNLCSACAPVGEQVS